MSAEAAPPLSPRPFAGWTSVPAPRGWKRCACVAVLFLAFAVAELWEPIVHSGWYLPADIGQLFSLTRASGQPIPPKNSLESDVYVDFAPFLHYDVAQVRSGHLPTWNPDNGNGVPYLADGQTVVFSPFTVFFYVMGFRLALLAAALARLWLLGFFTYLFLLRHKMSHLAAAVGGAVFAYAGYHLVWLDYQTHVSVSAWLPVALLCTRVALDHRGPERRSRSRRGLALSGLAVVVAFMIFGGHPETLSFDGLLIVLYAVVCLALEVRAWRPVLRSISGLVVAVALGVGLSAVQLLPLAQYESGSTRAAQVQASPRLVTAGFLVDTVPLVAFPNLFGGPQFDYNDAAFFARHFPQNSYAEVDGNSTGLLALCLLPLGVLGAWRRRRPPLSVFGALALVLGSVALYTRFAGSLWRHVPVLGASGLNRSQDVFLMGVAVMAALGVDWFAQSVRRTGDRQPRFGPVLVLVASFAMVTTLALLAARHLRSLISSIPGNGVNSSAAERIVHGNIEAAIVIAAVFVVGLTVCTMVRGVELVRILFAGTAVSAAFASNGIIMASYNPTVSTAVVYPITPGIAKLKAVVGSKESLFVPYSFPFASTNLWFGIDDVGSYDAIGFRWHDTLYDRVFGVTSSRVEQMPDCVEGLQLFGVERVVGGDGTFGRPTGPALQVAGHIEGVPYFDVPGSARVSLVGKSLSVPGDATALDTVARCSFDPDTTVVLDGPRFDPTKASAVSPGGTALRAASARIVGSSAASLTVDTSAARPAWLVVRDTWAPGWTATVDGRSEPVQRADVAFQAVRVPAGTHVVRLVYRPGTVSVGVIVSLASCFLLVLAVAAAVAFGRRRPQAPVPASSST